MDYKNGLSWEAIPSAALYGTYGGTVHVAYPRAAEFDGLGAPCGAVGRPQIVIRTPWMTDSGMAFWRNRFASDAAVSASFSVEVFDHQAGSAVKYAGYLHRPAFDSIGRGAAAGSTVYRNVEIIVSNCTVTT